MQLVDFCVGIFFLSGCVCQDVSEIYTTCIIKINLDPLDKTYMYNPGPWFNQVGWFADHHKICVCSSFKFDSLSQW